MMCIGSKLCLIGSFLAVAVGNAGVLYQNSGTFAFDSDTVIVPFSIGGPGLVTIFTSSFGDGSGGFEPVITLFDGGGNLYLQDAIGGTIGNCGARSVDPISGFCLDAFIQTTLAAGNYTVTLSESDNIPGGPTLADGFPQAPGTNFTGPEFLGVPGSFILFDGSQRNANWTLEIDSSTVPEPGTLPLLASAFASAFLIGRPRRQNPQL
jgi:hypothetical protein